MAILEELESRMMFSSAPPPAWVSHGPGGGGALFSPSFNPANSSELYTVTDMSEVYHSTNLGQAWTFAPFQQLQGGRPTQIQFTSDPNTRFTIGTNNGNSQVPMRTTDGGTTWSPCAGWNASNIAYGLWADPASSSNILVTDYNNLYLSTDGGKTFAIKYVSPNAAAGCYVAGVFFDGLNIYVGTNSGMLVSSDGGVTFTPSLATGLPIGTAMISFAGAKQGGVTRLFCVLDKTADVYNGVFTEGIPTTSYSGVYSIDAGQNAWANKSTGVPSTEFPVIVSMARSNISTVYLGGTTGAVPIILKSTAAGASWTDTLITAGNANVATGWQGAGGDRDWTYGQFVEGFQVAPSDPNTLAFTDLGFIHVSTNGGASWQQAYVNPADQNPAGSSTPKHKPYHSVGLEDTSAHWMTWADASNVVAGYTDIYGAHSSDGGASWAFPTNISLSGNSVYQISPVTTTSVPSGVILYAATSSTHDIYESTHVLDSSLTGGGKIIYSADKGATWATLHDFGHPVIYTATDPTNPHRLYASVINSTTGGVYVTNDLQDGAASVWTKLTNPPRTAGHTFNIKVLKDGSLVATYSAQRATINGVTQFTATSGVFYSTDGGQTWADRTLIGAKGSPGMQYWTKDITIDPSDATQSTWYAAVRSGYGGDGSANDKGGLYKTTNKGVTWTRIFSVDSCESCSFNPVTGDLYLATNNSGLWYCANPNAASPTFAQTAYAFHQPARIFFNPNNPAEVWVASFGDGIAVGDIPFATSSGATIDANAALAGGPMTISTANGLITLTAPNGTYSFPSASFSSVVVSGTTGNDVLNVNAGAKVTFASVQHLGALNINGASVAVAAGGANTLVVKSLALSNNASLDLADNSMIIDYAGTSPISSVRGLLAGGFNAGAWNGAGINSSSAAADSSSLHALGYAEASDLGASSFMGETVDSTAVLVRYTKYGDNTLDGTVDIGNDFNLLLDGLSNPSASSWVNGDYTFDGKVDLGNDFNLFLRSFLSTHSVQSPSASIAPPTVAAPAIVAQNELAPLPAESFDNQFFDPGQ
jgi:hypothetical protein